MSGGEAVLSLAEARLFARAASGERAALAEVWRDNRRWIASVLAAHAPRGVDVEDLLQEVAATLVANCSESHFACMTPVGLLYLCAHLGS